MAALYNNRVIMWVTVISIKRSLKLKLLKQIFNKSFDYEGVYMHLKVYLTTIGVCYTIILYISQKDFPSALLGFDISFSK